MASAVGLGKPELQDGDAGFVTLALENRASKTADGPGSSSCSLEIEDAGKVEGGSPH